MEEEAGETTAGAARSTVSTAVTANTANTASTSASTVSTASRGTRAAVASTAGVDTCSSIATESGMTVETLLSLNPGLDCATLQNNARVCLSTKTTAATTSTPTPTTTATTSASGTSSSGAGANTCNTWARIGEGGSCDNLAARNGIPLSDISRLNPGLDCLVVQPNTRLCVGPLGYDEGEIAGNTSQSCGNWHRIGKGDVCGLIAIGAGITLDKLLQINPQANCGNLEINSRLCTAVC